MPSNGESYQIDVKNERYFTSSSRGIGIQFSTNGQLLISKGLFGIFKFTKKKSLVSVSGNMQMKR
jgi:hypothetical protein